MIFIFSCTPDRDFHCFYPIDIILSHTNHGKDKNRTAALPKTSHIIMLYVTLHIIMLYVTFQRIQEQLRALFSSPEPKAQGELIVWDSSRCPSVRRCVCPHFQTLISLRPADQSLSNFIRSIIGVGDLLCKVLGLIGSELWFPWQQIAPIGL